MTTVLENRSSTGAVFRWIATSADHIPNGRQHGRRHGRHSPPTATATSSRRPRTAWPSTAATSPAESPLEFQLDFSQITGLADNGNRAEPGRARRLARRHAHQLHHHRHRAASRACSATAARATWGRSAWRGSPTTAVLSSSATTCSDRRQLGPADPGRPRLARHRRHHGRRRRAVEHRHRPEPDRADPGVDAVPRRRPGDHRGAATARRAAGPAEVGDRGSWTSRY